MTKLLVTAGVYVGSENVEIINLDEENPEQICDDLPDLIVDTITITGQLFMGKIPIICGGRVGIFNCVTFQNGYWKRTANPTLFGTHVSSAILTNSEGKDVLFVSGGNHNNTPSNITMTFDGTVWNYEQSENLPYATYGHCTVKVNSSTLISIGGFKYSNDTSPQNNVYMYNVHENKWTPGPSLNKGRGFLSCGILKWNNPETNVIEKIVVVAEGRTIESRNGEVTSVELLHLKNDDSFKGEWVMGPELPFGYAASAIIEYNNSIIISGNFHHLRSYHMHQLFSPRGPWIKMKPHLKKPRCFHVAFLVPDELVNCHY